MRLFKKLFATSCLVLLCVFALTASVPNVPTGTWKNWNPMGEVRSGATAVLLQDGRILISGGSDSNGALASSDLFGTNGVFSAAAPMNSRHSGHTATLLGDGRVLVTGGDAGGGITNSAEVYNPNADSWTQLSAPMLDARAGHTASLLPDGRVLLAGGHNSSGALSSLEIFDPLNDSFTSAGILTSPRMNHAAAVLLDGRVLVIGGTADGVNALDTVDIYDPVSNTVAVGPILSTPRMSATATTTLDGKVAVIGGSNGSGDLASAEVFDPATGQIAPSASGLATPRSGHRAVLLPNNNAILIVGGTSAGTDLSSAELYFPWGDSFQTTGAMSVARPGLTGSALGLDGRFLAAGGTNLASTELYGFATVKTDAADYPPGTVVTITGSGWRPGETVILTLVEYPLLDAHGPYIAVADGNGNISDSSFITDEHDLNIRFYVTAVGAQSGSQAQNTFTDAKPNTVTVGTQSPNPVAPGSSAAYTVTVNFNGNSNSCTSPLSVTTALPAGATASFSPSSVTSTGGNAISTLTISTTNATPPGSSTFTVLAGNGGATCQAGTASNTGTLIVVENTATTLASLVNPSVFGQSTTLTATVAQVTGPTTPTGGTVTFLDGATSLGTATLSAGTASISTSALTAGSHSLTASYAGATNFGASTSAAVTQTVNKANTTTTVSNSSGTFGGPNVTLSANVTAASPSTAAVNEGTVTFTIKQGATTIGTVTSGTVAAGAATASFSLGGVNAGAYTINATYNPAATTPNFNTSTAASPGALTVSAANTTTTVGNSSGTTGGSANLTANVTTVSPSTAAVNEGTVTFTVKQGATTIGTVTSGTVAGGTASASFSLSGVVSGTYNINATYNPAATPNFNTSTAATAGTLTVNNPVPTTTSISPTSKNVGDATFTLTVNGTNFVTNSVVNFSGSPRTTSFVSATQLTASIPASDLTTAGTFNIKVTNPAPGGGTSNAQTFTVNNLVPTTISISPTTKTAGDAAFTLMVNGTNFVNTSTVNFNGSARTTTFVNDTQITAAITATDVSNAGSFPITVTNPAPGGGTSNAQTLIVNPKMAFSTNSFATLIGLCSPQISVQLQNGNGSAATRATPTTLNLTSDSGGAAFFSDAACSSPTTTALIAANTSTGSFFYKDTLIGDPVITVAATDFTSIQQTEAFTSLRFNSAAFSVQTNACSSPISLQSADAQTGSPTSLTQPTTINLGSSSASGKFYSDASCTAQITTTLISPAIDGGHDTNNFFYKDPTAGAPALTASAGTALAQQTESVVAPPSISKSFGAATIPVNGTTSLSFTITNPAANTVALTGVAFTDPLPAGVVVATPNGITSTCGGTATAIAGSGSVALGTGTVAINNSCSISVNVTGTTSGVKNNTTGAVTSTNGGTGNTASASITVASPPTISKAFGTTSIPVNGSTSLSFTINNPNTIGLSGVAFSDTLPGGLVVATPNGLSSSCGGTTTAVAGSGSVSLTAGTATSSSSCSISLNVTGMTTGLKSNTTSVITATESGPGTTSNTATLTVNTRTTSTSIAPLTSTTSIGQSTNFTITITDMDNGPLLTPAGSVSVSSVSAPSNTDSISACTLAQTVVGTATCQVTVTPTSPTGIHTLSASFTATDSTHGNSSTTASAALTVTNPATTTHVMSSLNPSTYGDSVSFTATVSSDAGTPTGSVEFHEGACGGLLLAGPTGLNGSGQAVFSTATLNAGAHTVAACYMPTGVFLASDGSVSQTVNRATPAVTISFAASSLTYDGDPHAATATVTGVSGALAVPANGTVAINYKKSALPFPGTPTDAGSYSASAHFTSTNANYNDADSTVDAALTIAKADPVLSSVGGTFTYDGLPHGGSATATGVKGESLTPVNVAYKDSLNNLLTSAPVDAGSYLVAARFAGNDNYNQKQSAADPLIINKADTTTVLTVAGGETFTYDGDPHPATVSVTGPGGLNLTPTPVYSCGHAPINVVDSGCTASYSYAGTNNYNPSSDSKTYTINKADSVTTVTGGTFVFDGLPHSASVSVTGVGGLSLTPAPTYSGGCVTAPTNVAQTQPTACTASYTFTGDDNHNGTSGSAVILINKADSVTTVTGGTFVFDGLPHSASVSVTGVGGLTLTPASTYSGGCVTAPTNVAQTQPTACTASYTFAGDNNHNGSSGSAVIVINKADSVTTVTGGTFVFDGLPHSASVSVTGVGGLSLTPAPTYSGGCVTAPTNVAQTQPTACTASYTFAGDDNHNGSSGSAAIIINKAASVTTIDAGYPVIYNSLPHGVTANVTGAGGLNQVVPVLYVPGGSTVPVNPGTYTATATFAGDADHLGSSAGPVTITITYGACSAGVGPGGVILQPINSDGTSVYNRKGGSTIPVKFTVCDASGNPISNPAAVFAGTGGSLTMLSEVRGTVTVVNETGTNDIPDVAFRYTGSQWIFNMATTNLNQGSTYTFRINLAYQSIIFKVGVK